MISNVEWCKYYKDISNNASRLLASLRKGKQRMKIKDFLTNLFNRDTPKISCPKCREIHELNANACCPRCGTKYKLSPEYIELARKKLAAQDARDRRSARILSVFGILQSNSKKDSETSKRTGKKLRIISYVGAIAILCAVFVLTTLLLFSDKEPLHYKTDEPENQPVFFCDTEGIVHYLFPDGTSGNIGKGTLHAYNSSSDGKNVYFTFTGHLSPTENYTSNTNSESFLLKLTNKNELSIITEGKDVVPEFLAAGDCEYLYIKLTDKEDTRYGSVSVLHNSSEPQVISEKVRDICVSPNGRYALVSVEDDGATKLMKYSFATSSLDNPGVKNAYPLSVDNKGEYIVYARKSDSEHISVISEKDTSSRVEIPIFNDAEFKELIFAADRRSFAICYNDRMTFYNCGTVTYSTMAAGYGSSFGYDKVFNRRLNLLSLEAISKITDTENDSLLPYCLFDSEKKNLYCLDDGTQTQIFGKIIDSLVISECKRAAFTSDGKLYCGVIDVKSNKCFEMGEFGGKKLVDISPDGKLISYTDGDGNLFTIKYGKTLAEQNMGTKRSVDVSVARFSSDSKKLFVHSDGISSIINLKNNEVKTVAENLIPESTVLLKDDLSEFIYAAKAPEGADGIDASLYIYKDGKSTLVCDKYSESVLGDEMKRIDMTLTDLTAG